MPSQMNEIKWESSLMLARRTALREDKVLLVYFCGGEHDQECEEFEGETLHHGDVVHFVEKYFVPVKLDLLKEQQTAQRWNVCSTPTLLVLDEQQQPQHCIEGKMDAYELLGQLSLGLGKLWLDHEWFEKSRTRLDKVIERHAGTEVAAEAQYWKNVGIKRQDDSRVEEANKDSFPASDPPSWNLGRDGHF